jgi:transcriptional regulator with XRE-family HTH domain
MLHQRFTDINYRQSDGVSYDRTEFGQRLRDARERAGLTQEQVADSVGIRQSTLADLERKGTRSGYIAQLATLYGVSAHWLATGAESTGDLPDQIAEVRAPNPSSEGARKRGAGAHLLSLDPVSHVLPVLNREQLMADTLPRAFAVVMPDDSMAPWLRKNDIVKFAAASTAAPGELVLVASRSGAFYVREFRQRTEDHWSAHALNAAYETMDAADDGLRLLGVFRGLDRPGPP